MMPKTVVVKESHRRCLNRLYQLPIFALFLSLLSSAWSFAEPLKICYLSSNEPGFWQSTRSYAQEVAADLGIELQLEQAETRFEKLAALKRILSSTDKPDYLIFSYPQNSGAQMLEAAEQAEVKSLLVNSAIPDREQESVGAPRATFKHWLGHMYPDDRQAGYLLADRLIHRARMLGLKNGDGKIEIVGIGGPSEHLPAVLRNEGLKQRVAEDPDLDLKRIVRTNWVESHTVVETVLQRYPNMGVIWAASDHLAMQSSDIAAQLGKRPGKSLVSGGIDWSSEGMNGLKNGDIETTIGGHFREAGWAVILLYDYHHGIDFEDELGLTINMPMQALSIEDARALAQSLLNNDWSEIDFRLQSKHLNPNLKRYQFTD
jgi:ABC-type sugar transport system substrate-binding protein